MAEGACNCGAVKFEINADLSDVCLCHCSISVTHHVGVGSKAVWDEIGDAGKQHPEQLRG
jgi:hypothetical protein